METSINHHPNSSIKYYTASVNLWPAKIVYDLAFIKHPPDLACPNQPLKLASNYASFANRSISYSHSHNDSKYAADPSRNQPSS